MTPSLPLTRDLVLLGGGHTHSLVLRSWAMDPLPGVRLTLVNPAVKAPYTGMLPGHVAGHYDRAALDIDLVRLARQAGARLVVDRATGIDTDRKRVELETRPDLSYDTLSVDIGIGSGLPGIEGFAVHVVPAKPLGRLAEAWSRYVAAAEASGTAQDIAIIGGGVAGVELALAMAFRLKALPMRRPAIRLIEAETDILRELAGVARRTLLAEIDRYRIDVLRNSLVDKVDDGQIRLSGDGSVVPAGLVVSAAGAQPWPWLSETGLDLHDGYIVVDETLRSVSAPDVFAAGDCAHLSHAPRPKAGVFAVREAPVLYRNLRAQLSGKTLDSYQPQRSYLKLISTGRRSAVMDKWGISLRGGWVWRLKDRIDRAFMEKFGSRLDMAATDLPDDVALGVRELVEDVRNHCGGCGAKVGQAALRAGLEAGTGNAFRDDAAIVEREGYSELFTSDHLRAFSPDPWLMGKIAAVHALGDIWAMGGTPQTVLAQLILPAMSERLQAETIREIMTAANDVFEACGTRVSGGHTSSGLELTIGFALTGRVEGRPITQDGARAGDVLVLTKPIGTGTLLAAEMRQEADGDDYLAALNSMLRLQDRAAGLLAGVATAMTDVTGFGLAGHLLNLADASGVAAELELDKVPVLPGAERLSEKGIRSTLWARNAEIRDRVEFDGTARSDLLFDPQTCGGLLASVPEVEARSLMRAFEAAGEPVWMIGRMAGGPPSLKYR